MYSNFWEEQKMGTDVTNFHEKLAGEMNLPEWIKNIRCPFCNKNLPLRSIRNIQLCLNTRNFGEIAVQVICDACNKMDTVYYRTNVRNISGFVDYLTGYYQVGISPTLEKEMYNQKYNCVVEEMIKQKGVCANVND